MIELPLIFVAGLLGTAHCLGMCGPMALALGGTSSSLFTAACRQLAYTIGRVFTYTVLGAAAGYGGHRVVSALPAVINVPAILAVVAGVLLMHQGLRAAGWHPRALWRRIRNRNLVAANSAELPRSTRAGLPCLAGSLLGSLAHRNGNGGALLAGVFTGFLPCGLLYGMLALATSTHSLLMGGATMAVFGFGTAPGMGLAGLSGQLIALGTRRRLFQLAAWSLVLTGAISIARGLSFLTILGSEPSGCPWCAP